MVEPYLRAQQIGSVILVASDASKVATPGESIIGAGMAAICMFARTAAMECKREGVRINVLTPSDLAEPALFLAGPGSARVTGQVISVNGGISVA